MPYIVLANALAFQRTDPANPKVPLGDEEIVTRGGFVPDYASEFLVAALTGSGLIAYADRPDPLVVPVTDVPVQHRTPDQPVILPSDPNGQAPVIGGDGTSTAGDLPTGGDLPALPQTRDGKEVWEAYAEQNLGMASGDVEAMSKTDLMVKVRAEYANRTA